MKEEVAVEYKSGESVESFTTENASTQQSTWQMVLQYKAAVLWSAFIGLAGINWGMDTLVSKYLNIPVQTALCLQS